MTFPPAHSTGVREMPEEDRPRERLARLGATALRDAELIAVLFRTGTRSQGAVALAEALLRHFGGLRRLGMASIEELSQVNGVGKVKAIELKAALELGMRLAGNLEGKRDKIEGAEDVAKLLMGECRTLEVERFVALLMNTKNEVIKRAEVSVGTLDGTLAMPRDVFRQAVREGVRSVIVCHNHPSGDPEPSTADIELTRRLKSAGEVLGVTLLDHVIIGDGRFVSLKERGIL